MTAGVLAALLAMVDPETPVRLEGEGYAGTLHVNAFYGPDGARQEAEVCLHPAGE